MPSREEELTAWYRLLKGRLRPGERVALPVLTGSMAPLMRPGNQIVVEATDWRACRRGDVVVFATDARLTAHRLLLVVPLPAGPLLYQKGDMNPRGGWLRAGRVVGRVVAVAPGEAAPAAGAIGAASPEVDLTTAPRLSEGRHEARRQLARDLRQRLLTVPRWVKRRVVRWLKGAPTSSG